MDDLVEIKNRFVEYYKKLLGQVQGEPCDTHSLRDLMWQCCLPKGLVHGLEREVTKEEIIETFKSLKDNKAPGLDGYGAEFYKGTWDITGNDVVDAIGNFFKSSRL